MPDQAPAYLTVPGPGQPGPAAALRVLAAQLRAAGITRLYGAACTRYGVLSVTTGLSVWTNGRVLWWQTENDEAAWPAADPQGAVRQLTTLATSQPSGPPPPDTS